MEPLRGFDRMENNNNDEYKIKNMYCSDEDIGAMECIVDCVCENKKGEAFISTKVDVNDDGELVFPLSSDFWDILTNAGSNDVEGDIVIPPSDLNSYNGLFVDEGLVDCLKCD